MIQGSCTLYEIDIQKYKSLFDLYSDGLVEDKDVTLDSTNEIVKSMKFQDDITLLYLLI